MERSLHELLEEKYHYFNRTDFIEDDPISIPHLFSDPRDIEIAGFFSAILAWGQRKTIINKCRELMSLMDDSPYQFTQDHSENDLKALIKFKHRTFNSTDLLYFVHFLKGIYSKHPSLEDSFFGLDGENQQPIEKALNRFRNKFISLPDFPKRTGKHISSPEKKSACKRLNMFFRWMVRKDDKGVDFGIWQKFKPSQLICPCDVHVEKVARQLGLITRRQTDWLTAVELTDSLRKFDRADPVKYDFALFGIGLEQKYQFKVA